MPAGASMHALRAYARNDPSGLRYEEAYRPTPGIGDVLVEVEAASFTPTELGWPSTWADRAGRDRTAPIPGHEVSGRVVELGYGTTGFSVGDEVFGLTDWYRDGSSAEFVAVEARNLARRPPSISPPEAAVVSLAGLTAWQALLVHGGLVAGQAVLIDAAGGGVGSLAVQLAKEAGARVVGMGRAWAHDLVLELGADVFIEAGGARPEAAGGDIDLVFDLVGGDFMRGCAAMVRPGGTVVSVVEPPGAPDAHYRSRFFVVEPDRGQLQELADRIEAGRLRTIVGQQVALRDGAAAFSLKSHGGVPGKVVLVPN